MGGHHSVDPQPIGLGGHLFGDPPLDPKRIVRAPSHGNNTGRLSFACTVSS